MMIVQTPEKYTHVKRKCTHYECNKNDFCELNVQIISNNTQQIYHPLSFRYFVCDYVSWYKCVFISEPSSPPVDMQLSALDSSSVLVSWRPPLEPNGIILTYWILYTGNITHPEHLWINGTHAGKSHLQTKGMYCCMVYYESFSLSLLSVSQALSPVRRSRA